MNSLWDDFVCPVHGRYTDDTPPHEICPTVLKCYPDCPRQREGFHCVYCEHRFGK